MSSLLRGAGDVKVERQEVDQEVGSRMILAIFVIVVDRRRISPKNDRWKFLARSEGRGCPL